MESVGLLQPFPDDKNATRNIAEYVGLLNMERQRQEADRRARIMDALAETWPAQLARSVRDAVTLPGDVYAGRVDPKSDDAVQRSFDLAGLVTAGAGVVPAGRNEMRMGIKAYHGSPHDFDRFDMSKIGTGEGAQAYGHGLYFAGNEGVARGYRDTLSRGIDGSGFTVRIDGNPIKEPTVDQIRAARFGVESTASGIQKQIDATRRELNSASPKDELGMGFSDRDLVQMEIDEYEKRLRNVLGLSGRVEMGPAGRMYEVELNTTPDRLLDWDAPLSAQPQAVRDALTAQLPPAGTSPVLDSALLAVPTKKGGYEYSANVGRFVQSAQGNNAVKLSDELRERGIDGIRYLDAGSRAAGDGSRNYVMFDDKLIRILRKYGVATAAALPAAALAELGITKAEAERMM